MTNPAPAAPGVERSAGAHSSFSDRERLLIEKAEQAILEGLEIERWYRDQESRLKFFPLDLQNTYRLTNRAEGFFSNLNIHGQLRSAMGCRQLVELGRYPGMDLGNRLMEFAHAEFQQHA